MATRRQFLQAVPAGVVAGALLLHGGGSRPAVAAPAATSAAEDAETAAFLAWLGEAPVSYLRFLNRVADAVLSRYTLAELDRLITRDDAGLIAALEEDAAFRAAVATSFADPELRRWQREGWHAWQARKPGHSAT